MKDETPPPADPRDPDVQRWKYVTLRLKALIRTDKAYLVDLGQGKVWIPLSAIRSTQRIEHGIFEIEVREDVIQEKRRGMRLLKERATGLKGSVLGEVVKVKGRLLTETDDSLCIAYAGKEMAIPRVCFSEYVRTPDGNYQFTIQKNYWDFCLQRLKSAPALHSFSTITVDFLRETDRAYLFLFEEREIWFPKQEVLKMHPLKGDRYEITVPTAFWQFKMEEQNIH